LSISEGCMAILRGRQRKLMWRRITTVGEGGGEASTSFLYF